MKITIECVGNALGVLRRSIQECAVHIQLNTGAVFPSFHQSWGDLSGVPRNVGRVSAANGVYVCGNGGISSAAISRQDLIHSQIQRSRARAALRPDFA